jgi:hypothetical protein
MISAVQPASTLFNLCDEERERGRANHGWWRQYSRSSSATSEGRPCHPPALALVARAALLCRPYGDRPRRPCRRSASPPVARGVPEGDRTRYAPPPSLRRPAVPPLPPVARADGSKERWRRGGTMDARRFAARQLGFPSELRPVGIGERG